MDSSKEIIISAENLVVERSGKFILHDLSFILHSGDHLAITGPAGSGKTTLGLILAGRMYHKGNLRLSEKSFHHTVWIEQQHHFRNLSNTTDLYYQQRFNSYDSEDAQTVVEALGGRKEQVEMVLKEMKIEYLADKPLIQLSNGENKKLQLAAAILSSPSALIMDQPFVGLDVATRSELHTLINKLCARGILIILVTTPGEIPECITKVLPLESNKGTMLMSRAEFLDSHSKSSPGQSSSWDTASIRQLTASPMPSFEVMIGMKHVQIAYNGKKILDDINWQVKQGERWLLSGHNGAGKSTLLSLITGDNPQAYANDIYLFDRKRGSGESIWDIKKQIGFLSPELHVFFDQGCTAFETVASGLFDTIGLFRQLSETHINAVQQWMALAGIGQLQSKRLFELSIGEQRIVLLARALVKNPSLLILDEPCQGLDEATESVLIQLIDDVCVYGKKTMVFVTHYANKRPSCIDHFIELDSGKIARTE